MNNPGDAGEDGLSADQIIARPVYAPGDGWSNEEVIQQVTLSDWNEKYFERLIW